MNNGGFSMKRFSGMTAMEDRIDRETGMAFTKSGWSRRIGGFAFGSTGHRYRAGAGTSRIRTKKWG